MHGLTFGLDVWLSSPTLTTSACAHAQTLTLCCGSAHCSWQTVRELQQLFLSDPENQRRIPEWGKAIFSPLCVCITPEDGEELSGFMKYAVALHRAHLMLSRLLQVCRLGDRQVSGKEGAHVFICLTVL